MTRRSVTRRIARIALVLPLALALSALGLTLLFERHLGRRVAGELAISLGQITAGSIAARRGRSC
jgi:hypothetical protein